MGYQRDRAVVKADGQGVPNVDGRLHLVILGVAMWDNRNERSMGGLVFMDDLAG
jgi:hypothetical protein